MKKSWLHSRKRIAYIFQNPSQALNPYKRIGKQLESVLKAHRQPYSYPLICEALKEVGIDSPDTVYNMYPFQLSGGQNQRIMIALCILSKPDILIADEPTSSIDASLRKRILDLLIKVNKKYQMSIILITHDFDVAKYLCERIHIMYGGLIVEEGILKEVFHKPLHPYTNELIKCARSLDLGDENIYSLEGSPITPNEFRYECPFYLRCDKRMEKCLTKIPPIYTIESRKVRCMLYEGTVSHG